MYMGSPIRPHEELAAGMVEADNECSICRGKVWTQCDCCEHDICQECTVKCAGCGSDNEYCLACAVKNGYVEIDGHHFCEECAGVMEELALPTVPVHEESNEVIA